jgi:hypothetical protein
VVAVNLGVMMAIDLDHRLAVMDLDVAAGFKSDQTVLIGLYAVVETVSGGTIDSTLPMTIDSARLKTVSLDVGAVADSDVMLALGSDLATVFASGRTVVLDLGGVVMMDSNPMTDPAVKVVIGSGRIAADDQEAVSTADSDRVEVIGSEAVQQDSHTVMVASTDAKAEVDSDVQAQAVINSDRRVVMDPDMMVAAAATMRDQG